HLDHEAATAPWRRACAARLRRDGEIALLAIEGELVLATHGELLAPAETGHRTPKIASTSPGTRRQAFLSHGCSNRSRARRTARKRPLLGFAGREERVGVRRI